LRSRAALLASMFRDVSCFYDKIYATCCVSANNELVLPHNPLSALANPSDRSSSAQICPSRNILPARPLSPLRLDLFCSVPTKGLNNTSPRSIEPQNMPKEEQSLQRLAVVETSSITKMHCARTDAPPSMQGGAPSSVRLHHVTTSTLQSKDPAWLLPPVQSTHYLIDDLLDFKRPAKPSPLLQRLLSDTSEQALQPSDPSFLEAYTSAVGHALEHADPISSRDKNRTSWKYWTSFLTLMNSPQIGRAHV
jgi:hypothetical protein